MGLDLCKNEESKRNQIKYVKDKLGFSACCKQNVERTFKPLHLRDKEGYESERNTDDIVQDRNTGRGGIKSFQKEREVKDK